MNKVGNFFVKIGQGIKKGFFGLIDWVKNTAWIQPLLIVGLIFGVILSIKPVTGWIDGLLNPDQTYAFYNEHETEFTKDFDDKLKEKSKDGKTVIAIYYSDADSTCASIEKTLRSFAASNNEVEWYCVNTNYTGDDAEEKQDLLDEYIDIDCYDVSYRQMFVYKDLVDKSYEDKWVDETGKLTLPLPLFVRYETGNIYGVKPNVNSSKTYDDLERFVIGDKTTDWNKTLDEYILSRE